MFQILAHRGISLVTTCKHIIPQILIMGHLFSVAGNGIQGFIWAYGVEESCSYFYFANTELYPALCQAPGVPTSFREHCKHLAVLRITKPQIHRSEGLSGGCFIAGGKSTGPVTNWTQSILTGSWQSVKQATLALLKLPDKAAEQSFLPQTLYFPLFLCGFP